jgi:hypothetical protein
LSTILGMLLDLSAYVLNMIRRSKYGYFKYGVLLAYHLNKVINISKGHVSFCHHLASVECSENTAKFTASIYGMSCIWLPHFIPIEQKHGQHGQFLFLIGCKFQKMVFETRRHNELLLCRNSVCGILYNISIFRADLTTNMAAIYSSCLWMDI